MSRYLVSEIRCLGCDALVSEQAGPVHAYMLAAPGCWALYGSLQQWKGALTGDDGLTTAQRAVARRRSGAAGQPLAAARIAGGAPAPRGRA